MLDKNDNHILGVDICDDHDIWQDRERSGFYTSDQLVDFMCFLLVEREGLLGDEFR